MRLATFGRLPIIQFSKRSSRAGWPARQGALAALILILTALPSAAQSPRIKNIELCNGADRTSPDPQIAGCTALIESGSETPTILTVAFNNRGNAYTNKGDYDRAIQDYARSIALDPNFVRAFNNRGVAYRRKGDYDRALADFNESIKLNPKYANAFANRAETYLKLGRYDRAGTDFDEAIKLQPELDDVWNGRCWTRAIMGQLQAALSDCEKAVRIDPNAAAFDSRALVYLKLGDFERAIADYNSSLQLDPNQAIALYGRGLAKLRAGDDVGAQTDIAAARKMANDVAVEFKRYGVQ
jgi:tetratricopeptide (TPR) repeat protein